MMERWAWRRPPRKQWAEGGRVDYSTSCSPPVSWGGTLTLLALACLVSMATVPLPVGAVVPLFHEATKMSGLRLPADTSIDIIVYRLRASDAEKNYPLLFSVRGTIGNNLIYITPHECSYSNSIFCEADVYLKRPLEAGRVYIFNLTVADTSGDQTEVVARVDATTGRTPMNTIFLKYDSSVSVPEDKQLQTEVTSLVVRKRRSSSFIEFDLLGDTAHDFRISGKLVSADEVRGSITLVGTLDYETRNLHNLNVCAMNPYTDEQIDTRNIACVGVAVAVLDVQDTPPIFINAPPVTRIPPTIQPGDVLVQLEARDGDQGSPRAIRFSIMPASADYANFFRIDPFKGTITMVEPVTKLMEKMVTLEPILMTVTAEEVETAVTQYPALSTQIEVAFVLVDSDLPLPKFVYQKYTGEIRENSPPDTQVYFASPFLSRVSLEDKGVKGVFSLTIEGDSGIFAVNPNVIRDSSDFVISVKNSLLLDFETRKSVDFTLIARPVTGARQASSTADITVNILDTNDNPPVFSSPLYQASIYENITASTSIIKVTATDVDSGSYGSIRYTRLNGRMADHLALDPITGVVTCATNNGAFDRDHGSDEYQLTVEARDDDGAGNSATARLVLKVLDVNDEVPKFKKDLYVGVLDPTYEKLVEPVVVEAVDDDATEPNNQIVYSLERTTYSDYFSLDAVRGILTVKYGTQIPKTAVRRESAVVQLDNKGRKKRQASYFGGLDNTDYITLSVRASDLGVPQQSSAVPVKIQTKDYVNMQMTFIYPMSRSDVFLNKRQVERTLNVLTGAVTEIKRAEPYRSGLYGSQPVPNKSYLTVDVRSRVDTVVDVDAISEQLLNNSHAPIQEKARKAETKIEELQSAQSGYVAFVVILCLLLAAVILTLIACCYCAGCPLHRGSRKQMSMVTDENGEGISYIKMDEYGNPRPDQEKIWWDYLPNCLTDLFLSCGCQRPDTGRYFNNSSRMAWSGDERQRHWRVQQQAMVDNESMPRRLPRDMMQVEDMDEARLHRQSTMQNVAQQAGLQKVGDMGEPRKVFVLRDRNGNPHATDHLEEGHTYLVEDVDETPRNIHLHETVSGNSGGGRGGVEYGRTPGNGENLRLHAGPRDVASLAELMRRPRRAGDEPGGTQYNNGDPGGGGGGASSSRYADGQSVGVTPSSEYYEDYTGNANNYVHGGGGDARLDGSEASSQQVEVRRRPANDTVVPRLRIKSPNEDEMMEEIEDSMGINKGKIQGRHNRADGAGQGNIEKDLYAYHSQRAPNQFGYQHTKASILRYESNMAKLDEDQQREAEKDPLYTTMRKNSAVQAEARRAAAYAAEDESLETRRTLSQAALELKQRRDTVGLSYDKPEPLERSGSVPNIQTNLERDASLRGHSRRGSLADDEYYDELNRKVKRSDKNRGSIKSRRKQGSSENVNDPDSNLPDDAKSKASSSVPEGEMSAEALKALEEEMKKDSEEGDQASKAATDRSRKKRNQMTEKKSVFTIAFDDIQTKQLSPELPTQEP